METHLFFYFGVYQGGIDEALGTNIHNIFKSGRFF